MIGSSQCEEFKKAEARQKACLNLIKQGISNLVVIGGDGTLLGAHVFSTEWANIVQSLLQSALVTPEQVELCSHLNVVGLVSAIDNDFCGTDMTIGADSALHRILEAVDCIVTTAQSHQRCFVLEVMGKNSGYVFLCVFPTFTHLRLPFVFIFPVSNTCLIREENKKTCSTIV